MRIVRNTASLTVVLLLNLPVARAAVLPVAAASEAYAKLPMQFERNSGQAAPDARFVARGRGYSLLLLDTGAVFNVSDGESRSTIRMQLRGSRQHPRAEPAGPLPGVSNYLVGSDPRRWRTNVPTFERVLYREPWPGIDMVYYGSQTQLEYDFVVHPGADPRRIRLRFDGLRDLRITADGDLVMRTAAGEARHRKPLLYQETAGGRREISGGYVMRGQEVGFEVGAYDVRRPLVIDPTFLYSTFLAGSNYTQANAIAVDSQGNAYVTGYTQASDFPSMNPYKGTNSGNADVFVSKLNATGTALIYSTYVGGSSFDYGGGIAVDSAGNAYVAGYTLSTDFPAVNAMQAAKAGGFDAFVFKLNAAGNQLLFSTYFGGSGDEFGRAIAVDSSGNPYLVGQSNSSDLPVTPSAAQGVSAGAPDAFALKLTTTGAKAYATYLGGDNSEDGNAIAVDAAGNAYVTGWTYSTNFPTTVGAYSRFKSGGNDIYVSKINPAGTALVFSTLVGGNGSESGNGIAVDNSGVYVAGDTWSTDFPFGAGAAQNHLAGANDVVVFKLDPTGSSVLWGTYLGGSRSEQANALAVDSGGNVYVAGATFSAGFPVANALQSAKAGVSDPLYKSTDAGSSWNPLMPANVTYPTLIQVSPASASTVFVVDCATLFRSADSGASWTQLGYAPNGCAHSLAIDPAHPSALYMGMDNGVQKSVDGGSTWNAANTGLPATAVVGLAIDAGNRSIIYAATNSGLFKSTDGGGSWNPLAGLPTANIRMVSAHPTLANVVFAGLNGYCSIWRSQDGGATWSSQGLNGCPVSAISFSAANPNVGYLVFGPYTTAKTADAGVTWAASTALPVCCVYDLAADPNNPNWVYAMSNTGVYKSTDGAISWSLTSGPLFTLNALRMMSVAPTKPATVYVASYINSSGFVAKLNPTGTSILYSTYLAGGGDTTYASGIAVDNAGTAFVAGYTDDTGFPITPGGVQPVKMCCRSAFVTRIGDATPACSVTFSASARTYGVQGTAQDSIAILSPSGCAWSAATAASWIHLISGIAGAGLNNTGAGTVFFSVDSYSGASPRIATITAGGQTVTITQTPPPLLSISLGHSGSFSQGQFGAAFTMTVSNAAGTGPTTGYVYAHLPDVSGLTMVSISGTGWTCPDLSYCFRYDTLNAAASYPPLTVTVNVSSNARSPLLTSAYVYGGGAVSTMYGYDSIPVIVVAPYLITTLAGGNLAPTAAVATSYPLPSPMGVAADSFGNLYVASDSGCVFKIDANATLTRFAGTCRQGYSGDGGPAINAGLNHPHGLAVDSAGNVFIADAENYRIRKVSTSGIITTVAGNGASGYSGDGVAANSTALDFPYGITVDPAGNLYIATQSRIRKVSVGGIISTVAGNGASGFSGDGGPATSAALFAYSVAVDSSGNLYVADTGNYRIRKVSAAGIISTIAGTGAYGYSGDGGPASGAQVSWVDGIVVDSGGNLYLWDGGNYRIRKISAAGTIMTVAGNGGCCFSGDGGTATSAVLSASFGLALDPSGNLYSSDWNNSRIRKVSTGGIISTVAGGGSLALGDGGSAATATLNSPYGVATDSAGNIYIADKSNHRVRRVSSNGAITTVAGNGGCCSSGGDGGSATNAEVLPNSIAFDTGGNLYIGDIASVRKVTPAGIITTVAGTGVAGYAGDGGSATGAQLSTPGGLAIDAAGNLYIADTYNQRIRKVSTGGTITTIAGSGVYGFAGDGGAAISAQFEYPYGLVLDAAGNLYIADQFNYRVRKVATEWNNYDGSGHRQLWNRRRRRTRDQRATSISVRLSAGCRGEPLHRRQRGQYGAKGVAGRSDHDHCRFGGEGLLR